MSALVPYKRVDVAIEACRRIGAPLTIVGTGPELARLEAIAGPDVAFRGWLSNEEIRDLYHQSAAVLLPGVEDFGMVPVEAQACGCPVVALADGGAMETVVDGVTGVLVQDRSAEAFAEGLSRASTIAFDRQTLRQHALTFSRDHFLKGFAQAVDDAISPTPPRDQAPSIDQNAASCTRERQPAAIGDKK